MSKSRLVDALKNNNKEKSDEEIAQATAKMENQKRLSTQEFQKVYETLWKEGPSIKYENIGSRERIARSVNQDQTLW